MNNVTKIALSALALLAGPTISNAQTQRPDQAPRPGVRISAGVNQITPVVGFRNTYNTGYGAWAQVAVPLTNKLYATAGTGINTIYARENSEDVSIAPDMRLIPAKVGLQYFPVGRLYVQGEAGASFLTNQSSFDGAKTTAFTVAPQVGYLIPLGKAGSLDAGIRYENISRLSSRIGASRFFGFKLGYAFQTKK